MNERIQVILDSGFKAPPTDDLEPITKQLLTGLASTEARLREGSMEVLWRWGQVGVYSNEELISLGQQMATTWPSGWKKLGMIVYSCAHSLRSSSPWSSSSISGVIWGRWTGVRRS